MPCSLNWEGVTCNVPNVGNNMDNSIHVHWTLIFWWKVHCIRPDN